MEIPVYLFVGFLDGGKTRFMQGTLEDKRFNDGERTLVLMCEEGEEELEPKRFAAPNVFIETVEEPEELTPFLLTTLSEKHAVERVMIEYNGMWELRALLEALPENFLIYEQYFFGDANSFLTYNANMRQLTVDKLRGTALVVLNRDAGADRDEIHKVIRGVNRQCDILYELPDGTVEPDEREDPLPYDINAPVIEVEDKDYAIWYREVSEEPKPYIGKTVRVKGMIVKSPELPDGAFICGRHVMTCCVEDIQFAGFISIYRNSDRLPHKGWAYVTAKIDFAYHPVYGGKGPLLRVTDVALTAEPDEPVATFY